MLGRISENIELGFWQVAVRVLSAARPLRRGIEKMEQVAADHPSIRDNGWAISAAGWIFGLVAGILISTWI